MIGNAPPLVSVVMPCYNAAAHLARGVGSVLDQDFSRWELIAVDDGSNDGTLAALQAFTDPRIRLVSQANAGVSAARNAGLAVARGRLVAFLDSDDTWSPCFLSRMAQVMEDAPEVGLVYCGWRNLGLDGPRGEPFVPPDYEGPDKQSQLLEGTRWPIHACMTRTELVQRAGGFDRRFAVGEDFLLWLEIACFQPIRRVPEVLAQYIHHGGVQATRDRVRAARQLRDVQSVFLARHPEVVRQLGQQRVRVLTDGVMLRRAYEAYWRRDLGTAQPIFRMSLIQGGWAIKDLKYLLPALLPPLLYRRLIPRREG